MSENDRNNLPLDPVLKRQSKLRLVKYQDDDGNIRYKTASDQRKFREEEMAIFVSEYAKHGRIGDAARAAGVTAGTVKGYMDKDEDFALLCWEAEQAYRDRLLEHHQNLIFDGELTVKYDRHGNIVEEKRTYPIRLIELELKKHDEGYRDKREVKMDVTGGVLVAPAETTSIEDWESRFLNAEDVTPDTESDSEADEVQRADTI